MPLAHINEFALIIGDPDGLMARICIGLPLACASLDDEAARQMLDRMEMVHASLDMLERQTLSEQWQRTLQQLADQIDSQVTRILERGSGQEPVIAVAVEGDASILGLEGRITQELESLLIFRLESGTAVAQAIALGAARAGLKLYIAYPMTPSSSILHFLAQHEEELGLVTFHPENEIAA